MWSISRLRAFGKMVGGPAHPQAVHARPSRSMTLVRTVGVIELYDIIGLAKVVEGTEGFRKAWGIAIGRHEEPLK